MSRMSFVRVGRPQQHSKGKRPVRPKKAGAPKRDWVSTVNDLSVHKLTPAELSHRHEIHKSHNKAAAQWELREKALKRRLYHSGSPSPLDQASLSIIREVFSDQLLLQDVLARSDRAMAVVKDLFGDAPHRQTGHPSVTMAPNCDSDSELPVLQRPDPPTQLSLLSQSMMDQQALNELQASDEDHSEEDTYPSHRSRNHVIRRTNKQKMKTQSRDRLVQQKKVNCPSSEQGNELSLPTTPATSGRAPDQLALNATVAVQRVRTKQGQSQEVKEEPSVLVNHVLNPHKPFSQSGRTNSRLSRSAKSFSQSLELDGSSVSSLSGDQSSLGLLQAKLDQVEADLNSLSADAVPESAEGPKHHRTQGLTGFSVALVSTLGRLAYLLKKTDEKAQKEAQERRKLEEQLQEQRELIDALTAEILALKEETAKMQADFQQRTNELEQKLDAVVLVTGGLGLLEANTDPTGVHQSEPVPEWRQAPVTSAVLLSPPQQRDNWQKYHVAQPLHQQLPPVANLCSSDDQAQSSASSLTSLPLTSLPSTSLSLTSDPLISQLRPEAMLAEIAQLSSQNDLIRAQLSQAKSLRTGVGGSPSSGSEQRSLSSSTTERITHQGVGERRMSASRNTGRENQNVQVTDCETHQVSSPTALGVSSVEQRLLELNRQSAAARARLLELIEEQKQCALSKVAPSVSPMPSSALSPCTAGTMGSPEVPTLLHAQEALTQAGSSERQSAGSEASSYRFGGETSDIKTQMEQQREREGWFSLSAHIK
ncbi:spindle and centriole-associated protein 1 isoform X2 [Echeneis naucrates]|uniref:spindle and centriole-associated protein 1 isoform X2 n=1 Tax=Echeneis naucrates TaxID=173247 RepID=UPI00111362BE|nr:spindle and centriole-associated protein 1 isoform X2 [Echeneis naucrates]